LLIRAIRVINILQQQLKLLPNSMGMAVKNAIGRGANKKANRYVYLFIYLFSSFSKLFIESVNRKIIRIRQQHQGKSGGGGHIPISD